MPREIGCGGQVSCGTEGSGETSSVPHAYIRKSFTTGTAHTTLVSLRPQDSRPASEIQVWTRVGQQFAIAEQTAPTAIKCAICFRCH
eukprot:3168770-Amphidinium_carterae.1